MAEDCLVPPPHAHFEPRTNMCPYYMMHTSGRQMTTDEVAYSLTDLVYCPDEDDLMTD